MHQSFVTIAPPPHLYGWMGDSGGEVNVWGSDLFSSPAVPGKCQAYAIAQIYPVEITIIKRGLWVSGGPRSAGILAGLWFIKSHFPAIPRRWGQWLQMTGA